MNRKIRERRSKIGSRHASIFALRSLIFISLLFLTSCTSTRSVTKIGLVAPFEGLYRQTGYAALDAMRGAIGEAEGNAADILPLALDGHADVEQDAAGGGEAACGRESRRACRAAQPASGGIGGGSARRGRYAVDRALCRRSSRRFRPSRPVGRLGARADRRGGIGRARTGGDTLIAGRIRCRLAAIDGRGMVRCGGYGGGTNGFTRRCRCR